MREIETMLKESGIKFEVLSPPIISILGTRGMVEEFDAQHKMQSATIYDYRGRRLLIDFGETWKEEVLRRIRPDWILVTHAHPDHVLGLPEGITVYGSKEVKEKLDELNIETIVFDTVELGPYKIERIDIAHSIKAPASSFRIITDRETIMHAGDILWPYDIKEYMKTPIDIYVGDGSTITRDLVRKKNEDRYGHASIKTQVRWCEKYSVKVAIFMHFGKEAIEMDERKLRTKLARFSERVQIITAYDGFVYEPRGM